MSRVGFPRIRLVAWIGSAIGAFLAMVAPVDLLAQNTESDRLASHLAAGEFGPALGIANAAASLADRDRMLERVSQAQFAAGARQASLSTAASIGDDRSRSATFDQLATQPFHGGRGGAAFADFDTLIELMKSTVAPESWDDAGGTGAAEPFASGVFVDATGFMRRLEPSGSGASLAAVRRSSLATSGNRNVRSKSPLRKVSLTRLERHAQRLRAMGRGPDEAMRVLAGLTGVQYVLAYPESQDIVIAGPAGDWSAEADGRLVSVDSQVPVLRLDDLVVVLRNAFADGGRFGCSINPRQENLASVQEFVQATANRSLRPGERNGWMGEVRDRLGLQDIVVFGIDPRTRAARILVEADYHMKRIGMGLEPGTLGVTSYLDSVRVPAGASPPPMDVLRWWFTLNFEPTRTTSPRDAFELVGSGVKVLSENEFLAERGERVHTGDATNLNRQFAMSFTKQFGSLGVKYPVYAELRNIFQLAMVAAIIRDENLADRCDWHQTYFGSAGKYQVQLVEAPKVVDSIVNHRLIDRRHLLVGVSGGVSVDTKAFTAASPSQLDTNGMLNYGRASAVPPKLATEAWWWD